MARRDIRINSKGFILVFVNPFWHLPCRCYEQGVYLGFCESVLQQKTQVVDVGFYHSYKICENLRESVGTKQSGVINVLQSYGILDGDCRFMTLSGRKEDFICNHVK